MCPASVYLCCWRAGLKISRESTPIASMMTGTVGRHCRRPGLCACASMPPARPRSCTRQHVESVESSALQFDTSRGDPADIEQIIRQAAASTPLRSVVPVMLLSCSSRNTSRASACRRLRRYACATDVAKLAASVRNCAESETIESTEGRSSRPCTAWREAVRALLDPSMRELRGLDREPNHTGRISRASG